MGLTEKPPWRSLRPLAAALIVLVPSCAGEASHLPRVSEYPTPAGSADAAATIDAALMRDIVATLADDAMEGRAPSTEGDERARAYMIDFLSDSGVEPGASDATWEQPMQLVGLTSQLPDTWTFRHDGGSVDLAWHEEYIAGSGVQRETVTIEDAELVFVGYGITAPEEDWDDYKGADLRGKILVMLNNDPDWSDDLFAGTKRLYYGRWTYKYESAARQGAAGAIIIHTDASAGYPWAVVQNSWTGEQFELPAGDEPRLELPGWTTEAAMARLLSDAGHDLSELVASARDRDFEPVPLGIRTSISLTTTVRPAARTANVLGAIRGSHPELKREWIVYTAHHDHLGSGAADADGDTIYNGARDNATGVAIVLAAARAFSTLTEPPSRSVLFLLVGAEEQGLLGSQRFASDPIVHPGFMVANLNFDSPAIFGAAEDIAVIGRGKSGLEDVLDTVAQRHGRHVTDEPNPDKGYYYRSDQFNFAKIGVPALYWKGGAEFPGHDSAWGRMKEDAWRAEHYHQRSDEIRDDWNFEGIAADARLAFEVGHVLAEIERTPGWRAGDEFEEIRQRMLAERPDSN